jgi:hypothetical protein
MRVGIAESFGQHVGHDQRLSTYLIVEKHANNLHVAGKCRAKDREPVHGRMFAQFDASDEQQ